MAIAGIRILEVGACFVCVGVCGSCGIGLPLVFDVLGNWGGKNGSTENEVRTVYHVYTESITKTAGKMNIYCNSDYFDWEYYNHDNFAEKVCSEIWSWPIIIKKNTGHAAEVDTFAQLL